MDKIWLASFPRSGNTLLRTILWQCFELRSSSVYENDLGGNSRLEEYVGHIEHARDRLWCSRKSGISLVKTHEHAGDDTPAIYVIRDGRAATASLYDFYNDSLSPALRNRRITLDDAVDGRHWAGSWSDHVRSWHPWDRPDTLLLKYEVMIDDPAATLDAISAFIGRDIVNRSVPDRSTIADVDGKYVRSGKISRAALTAAQIGRFNERNRDLLERAGYPV